jgi:hypothetical protein
MMTAMMMAREKQARQAAERYARYLASDPMNTEGRFPRSPQAVASQNNYSRRQVERHRVRRQRAWEAERPLAAPEPELPVITAEQVEVALLIACNFTGRGGTASDALLIAAVLGIPRDAFGVARDMLDGGAAELPEDSRVGLFGGLEGWLGEWRA